MGLGAIRLGAVVMGPMILRMISALRCSGKHRAAAVVLGLAVAVVPLLQQECMGAPSEKDLEEAMELAKKRGKEAQKRADELAANGIDPNELMTPPDNFMGQTNPGAAVGKVVVDTAQEVLNFGKCFNWKLIPGCMSVKYVLGRPVPVHPAYEYRWPMSRYEMTRQPFQSEYWPRLMMKGLQTITVAPVVSLLVFNDFLTTALKAISQGLKVSKPPTGSDFLNFIKSIVTTAFTKIPNKDDNKARGGGVQADGTTQTSVHAMPSPARYSPLSSVLQVLTIFGPVKSHLKDGFQAAPMPGWTESPELMSYARSPGRSSYIKDKELTKMWSEMLSDARACVRFSMEQWKVNKIADYMVPNLIDAGTGDVKPDKHPCLRFGNITWFPFDLQLNVSSEPMAAWVSMVKVAKLMSVTRGANETSGVRNWPDMYDLNDDRAQYLRGEELTDDSFRCTDIEKSYDEFGKANTLEHEAHPIMMTHWKRYSGCPPHLEPWGSCPFDKIERQRKFNPEVKNGS